MNCRSILFLLLTTSCAYLQSKEYSSFDDLKKAAPDKKVKDVTISFDLTGLDLTGWTFENAIFTNGSKGNTTLKGATITASKDKQSFFNSDMSATNFENATIEKTTFKGKVSDKSKFTKAKLDDVSFEQDVEAIFDEASKIKDVNFKGNVTGKSSFKNATIEDTVFEKDVKASFDGEKTKLTKVKFLGSYEGSIFDKATSSNCKDKDGKLLEIKDGKLKAS